LGFLLGGLLALVLVGSVYGVASGAVAGVLAVGARDTRGFFEHCGYGTPVQSLRRTL
jgi:hypothetical protein